MLITGTFGLFGLAAAGIGLVVLLFAPVGKRQVATWRQRWRVSPALGDEALRNTLRTLLRLRSWGLIFLGTGVALTMGLWLVLLKLLPGDFLLTSVLNGDAVILSAVAVGVGTLLGGLGRIYGVRWLRARSIGQPMYGGLRTRRVADFVPGWVGPAIAGWVLTAVAQALLALPSLSGALHIRLESGDKVSLPLGRWLVLLVPLVMAALLAVGALLIHWIVALPHVTLGSDLQESMLLDVLLRRESVNPVLLSGTLLMLYLSIAQWALLLDNLAPSKGASITMGLISSATLIAFAAIYAALWWYSHRTTRFPFPSPHNSRASW
jgi:hypothetical protein